MITRSFLLFSLSLLPLVAHADPALDQQLQLTVRTVNESDDIKTQANAVEKLLQQGANPNYMGADHHSILLDLLDTATYGLKNPTVYAKKIETMKVLIAHKADVNASLGEWNLLSVAIETESLEIVKTLIDAGYSRDIDSESLAWYLASIKNGAGISDYLSKLPSSKYKVDANSLFKAATETFNITAIDYAVSLGAKVPKDSLLGSRSFSTGAIGSPIDNPDALVEHLISLGADPKAQDEDGVSPILLLASDAKAVQVLLDHGSDINVADSVGNGIIQHLLADDQVIANPQDLIAAGFPDSYFHDFAAKKIAAIIFLLKHGAHVNATSTEGKTLLGFVLGKIKQLQSVNGSQVCLHFYQDVVVILQQAQGDNPKCSEAEELNLAVAYFDASDKGHKQLADSIRNRLSSDGCARLLESDGTDVVQDILKKWNSPQVGPSDPPDSAVKESDVSHKSAGAAGAEQGSSAKSTTPSAK